jgi:hypothetical protein
MDTTERDRLLKLPSNERKKIIEKLIQRVEALQSSQPPISEPLDYNSVDQMSFQEMCGLLQDLVDQEELEKPPPWPPELHQRLPRKPGGFRLFLSPNAFKLLSSNPNENDKEILARAVQCAHSNKDTFGTDMDKYSGHGVDVQGSDLSISVKWTKPTLPDDWEGFVFVFASPRDSYNCCPQLRFFHIDKPDDMGEFFQRCLEIPVSSFGFSTLISQTIWESFFNDVLKFPSPRN